MRSLEVRVDTVNKKVKSLRDQVKNSNLDSDEVEKRVYDLKKNGSKLILRRPKKLKIEAIVALTKLDIEVKREKTSTIFDQQKAYL